MCFNNLDSTVLSKPSVSNTQPAAAPRPYTLVLIDQPDEPWEELKRNFEAGLKLTADYQRRLNGVNHVNDTSVRNELRKTMSLVGVALERLTGHDQKLQRDEDSLTDHSAQLTDHTRRLDELTAGADAARQGLEDRSADIRKAKDDVASVMRTAMAEESKRLIGIFQERLDKEREDRAAERMEMESKHRAQEELIAELQAASKAHDSRISTMEAAFARMDGRHGMEVEERIQLARRFDNECAETQRRREVKAQVQVDIDISLTPRVESARGFNVSTP